MKIGVATMNVTAKNALFCLLTTRSVESGITVELTGRREFTQAAPEELSCETGYRRSGPTICYARDDRRIWNVRSSPNSFTSG